MPVGVPVPLDTVNNLGILHKNQGRLTEAESMYRRALSGF
jgi:Tfp pilus assembly protein PilF